MRLEVIENSGPNNLRDSLKVILRKASDVFIAVAFITQAGLDEIDQSLREAAARGRVRLLTGLYQKVTQPEALATLLRIQKQTRGRLSVKLSREPLFHKKLYVARGRTTAIAIVGSSNLTREGLRSGGELNVMTTLPAASPLIAYLTRAFDKDWKHGAVELTGERIAKYKRVRPRTPRTDNFTKGQLAHILGTDPIHRMASPGESESNRWRDCIIGCVDDRTEQIITDTTSWDDKKYDWYSTGRRHPYNIGDLIFLFDFTGKRLQLVQVKDTTERRTPDGRYFVAFKPVARLRERRYSKALWAALKAEKINRKTAKLRRKLGPAATDRLTNLVRRS